MTLKRMKKERVPQTLSFSYIPMVAWRNGQISPLSQTFVLLYVKSEMTKYFSLSHTLDWIRLD